MWEKLEGKGKLTNMSCFVKDLEMVRAAINFALRNQIEN